MDWQKIDTSLNDLDVVSLLFTSGSTGAPKAAALTHHGILNSAHLIGQKMSISSQDKIMVPVPLFHAFGLIIGKHFLILDRRTCVLMLIYDDRPLHNTNYWCHDCAAF